MAKAPTQEDLDLQAAHAAEAAQKAKDDHRAAEAKAAAAKKLREDEEIAARTALAELQRDTFEETYNVPVREKRKAFKQSVAEGGNTVAAWIDYMTAVTAAAQADRAYKWHLYWVAKDQHDAVNKQVNSWLEELSHMRQTEQPGTPHVGSNPPSGWWTPTVDALTTGIESPAKPTTRVQQINGEINRVCEALGKGFRRSPDDDQWFSPHLVSEVPRDTTYQSGEVEKWERRTYAHAMQDTINELVEDRTKGYQREVVAGLKARL